MIIRTMQQFLSCGGLIQSSYAEQAVLWMGPEGQLLSWAMS